MAKTTQNSKKRSKTSKNNKKHKSVIKQQTKKLSRSKSKRKSSKSKDKLNNTKIETSKGIKAGKFNWNYYNFWDMMFGSYFIKHDYMDGEYIIAKLIIYKEPKDDVRGFIDFLIDGPITLNRVDKKGDDSVHRIMAKKGDKIMFLVDKSQSKYPTIVDYIPKYQQDIKSGKLLLSNPDQEFRIISDDRIKDVRSIFSWLRLTVKPEYLKDILKRVEIIKGTKLLEKEKFKFRSNQTNN